MAYISIVPGFPLSPQNQKVRGWQLSIATTLASQNGSIFDAMLTWKQNLDKQFDGLEPCPICYSVVRARFRKSVGIQACGPGSRPAGQDASLLSSRSLALVDIDSYFPSF